MIRWNKEYNINISIIDVDHKRFVDIVNKAIIAKQGGKSPEEIQEILNEMIQHAKTHFKTEETYMKEFNYPEYQCHIEEHRDFSLRTNAYLDRVINGDCNIANEILEYLKQWLINHIQGTDKKYLQCFIKNGLK